MSGHWVAFCVSGRGGGHCSALASAEGQRAATCRRAALPPAADELCALRKPFDASNMPAIIFAIMRNRPQDIPATYSDGLRAMVKTLLQVSAASDRGARSRA